MAKRRKRQASDNPFERADEQAADFSLFDVDEAIYGEFEGVDAGREVVEPIPIHDISPDLTQPRRAIPSPVRAYWDGSPDTMEMLFEAWLMLANQERQVRGETELDFDAYLLSRETGRSRVNAENEAEETSFGPVETSLIRVIELAASIRRDGLSNPVTVAPWGNKYRLETGERRWLAFHMLALRFHDTEQWQKVPARVVDRVDVWRQASENNARADLNAIAKARQFAVLLMDTYRQLGHEFERYSDLVEADGSDRVYYAQVADGNAFDIPRGMGEKFVNAMGMKDGSQVRQLRQLLRLPDVVWQWADDLNWTVGRIRNMRLKAESEDELIWMAAKQAEREGLNVAIDVPRPEVTERPRESLQPGTPRHYKRFYRLLDKTGAGQTKHNQRALEMLMAHKYWLEEQEQILRDHLE